MPKLTTIYEVEVELKKEIADEVLDWDRIDRLLDIMILVKKKEEMSVAVES
jgi:hypothetical protein